MFHEPYVELIDNNGNNQTEVENLWKVAHRPDQMVLFCLCLWFLSPPQKKKGKSHWLSVCSSLQTDSYGTSGHHGLIQASNSAQDLLHHDAAASLWLPSSFHCPMRQRCLNYQSLLGNNCRNSPDRNCTQWGLQIILSNSYSYKQSLWCWAIHATFDTLSRANAAVRLWVFFNCVWENESKKGFPEITAVI